MSSFCKTEVELTSLKVEWYPLVIHLEHFASQANSIVISEVEAPVWLHRFIIGRKGANINRITQDHPKVL